MQTPPLPDDDENIITPPPTSTSQDESRSTNSNGVYGYGDQPSAFFSDPSMSPEEEIGSSIDDRRKKRLYRQQLRNAAAAGPRRSSANDSGSVGDTSLSSSNLSPMPERVVHLSLQSSNLFAESRRSQIKAAKQTPLMRLQSETSSATGGISDISNSIKTASDALLEAALLPPSLPITGARMSSETATATEEDYEGDVTSATNNNNTKSASTPPSADDQQYRHQEQNGQQVQHRHQRPLQFPKMPHLDSTDSLRGMDITSEQSQSGGEEETMKMTPNNTTTTTSPRKGGGDNYNKKASPKSSTSQPESDIAKRSRRKMAHHKRKKSGDVVAATFMNPGGKDWIGMDRDNLPLPEIPNDEDDSLLNAPPPPPSDQQQPFQHHQQENNIETSPLYPSYPSHATGEQQLQQERIFSPDSSEMYDFSDSSISNNNIVAANQQQQQYYQFQQQQQLSPNPQNFLHQQPMTGYDHPMHQHQYNNVNMLPTMAYANHAYSPPVQWYPPSSNPYHHHQQQQRRGTNNLRDRRSIHEDDIPDDYSHRHWSESEGDSEESSGDYGSGEGGSTTSSSYITDDEDVSKSTRSSTSSRNRNELSSHPPPHPFNISGHNKQSHNDASMDNIMEPPEIVIDRSSDTKFDRIVKRVTSVLDVPLYRTENRPRELPDDKKYPTFFCPNCKTKQRAFLSVATASEQHSTPLGYLALYFAVYMIASLFVFGLEEGWQPLDCVYFSVITLTTAGLGDFVPSTDGAKIVCACFIYVGVATIGLLLGSLLAGSLDDATKKDAYDAQVKDCPNCQRLERLKSRPMSSSAGTSPIGFSTPYYSGAGYEEVGDAMEQSSATSGSDASFPDVGLDLANKDTTKTPAPSRGHTRHMSLANTLANSLSPKSVTKKTLSTALPLNSALKRKSHTRHMSLANNLSPQPTHNTPDVLGKIDEFTPLMDSTRLRTSEHEKNEKPAKAAEVKFCDESSYSTSSTDTSSLHPSKPLTRLKAAKYIFLTLNQALANSVFVIAAGSIGFYYIEDMSVVDSFYFTTVLLTSVGYGDIVPVTAAGKMFTTVFIIVAGTILLHNMTLISMIPLELRKRRIEHAVLGQFGDRLTDDELRELSTGTLVNRLKLATNRPDGLDECTREMFSLAMLVRLGRVTEEDVKATFAAFRRLDVGNYGRLNSRTIIEGELMRRRALSSKNLVAMSNDSDWDDGQSPSNYSHDSYSQGPATYGYPPPYPHPGAMPMYAPPSYAPGLYTSVPHPRSQFSPRSPHSIASKYSNADHFNFDEYEQWTSNWNHYDTLHHARSH